MTITILGVDHDFQHNDKTGDFRKFVCEQLDKTSIDLIAEGAKETECSVGRQIAAERSISWLGIDATAEDKVHLNITGELLSRPTSLIFEGDLCVGQRGCYLPHADGIREELWVSRIIAGEANSALAICGLLHMQSLARRLLARDCDVSQINVCSTGWYKGFYGETQLFHDRDGNLWCEHRYKSPIPIFPR